MADDIEVGTLRAKIETDDTGISGTLADLTRQLKVVQSEFAATSAKLGGFASAEEQAKAKTDSLTQQMEIQRQKVTLLATRHAEAAIKTGENSKAAQNLQIQLNKAQAVLSTMSNELNKTTVALDLNATGFTHVAEAVEKAAVEEKTFAIAMKETKEGIELTRVAMIGLGVVMAGGMLAEWAEGSEKLAISLQKLQIETGSSAQVVERLAVVSSGAGVSTDQLASMVAKLDLRVNTATLGTGNFAKALSELNINAQEFGEKDLPGQAAMIAEAIHNSTLPAKELNGILKTIGITSQDTSKGIKYNVDIITAALAQTSQEGNTLGRVLEQAGIDINKFSSADIETKLQMLGKYFEETQDKAKATALVMTVFGKSGADMLPLIQNFAELDEYAKTLKMPVMDTKEIQIAAEKTKMLQTAMQMMMDSALVKILPIIDSVAKAFYDLAADIEHPLTAISNFEKELGLIPALITGVVAAFATMKIITSIITTIEAFTVAVRIATKAQLGLDAALDANPIGLIVIAVTALIASLVYLGYEISQVVKHWDTVSITLRDMFDSMGYHIKTVFNDIVLMALDAAYKVVAAFSKLTEFIPGLNTKIESARVALATMIDNVKTNQQVDDAERAYNKLADAAQKAAIKMKGAFDFKTAEQPKSNSPFPLIPLAQQALGLNTFTPPVTTVETTGTTGGGIPKTPEEQRKEAYDAALATAKFNAEFLNQSVSQQIAALNQVAAAHKQHLKEDIDDQRTMQLAVKSLQDEGSKDSKDATAKSLSDSIAADKAKFDFSKQWIADKKELNQLSASDEMAAWKRVSDQYKAGSAEKIEADKNYYSLKAAMDKQAAADKLALDKQAQEDAVKTVDDLGKAVETALKAEYAAEEKLEVAANQKSVENEQTASQNRMDIYQTEHDNKIALLESTSNAQTAALQAQMDAIDATTKAEDAATKEAAYQAELLADQLKITAIDNSQQIAAANQKLIDAKSQQEFRAIDAQAEYADSVGNDNSPANQLKAQQILNNKLLGLSQDVATAQGQLDAQTAADDATKADAKKSMADLVAQHDRDILLAQRDAQKAALQDQINAIQAAEVVAKTSIDNELKAKQVAETASLKATTDRLADEKIAINDHYDALNKEDAIQAEVRRLALDTNSAELITLLGTYNPQWQNAGQSYGESLLTGLNSTKASIQTAIDGILALVGKAQAAQAGLNVTKGLTLGITSGLPAVKVAAVGLAGAVVGMMNSSLGIQSPSKVTAKIGEFTGQGLVNGMSNTLSNIRRMAAQVATAAIPRTSSNGGVAMAGGSSSGGNTYNSFGDITINAKDLAEVKTISDLFNRLRQAARSK